jgi:hypothetical protein
MSKACVCRGVRETGGDVQAGVCASLAGGSLSAGTETLCGHTEERIVLRCDTLLRWRSLAVLGAGAGFEEPVDIVAISISTRAFRR